MTWGSSRSYKLGKSSAFHGASWELRLQATCSSPAHFPPGAGAAEEPPRPSLAGPGTPTPRTDPLFGSAFGSALQSKGLPGCGLSGLVGCVTPYTTLQQHIPHTASNPAAFRCLCPSICPGCALLLPSTAQGLASRAEETPVLGRAWQS